MESMTLKLDAPIIVDCLEEFCDGIKNFGDQTEQEKLHHKALLSQIQERQRRGDFNSTIRYIRGETLRDVDQ